MIKDLDKNPSNKKELEVQLTLMNGEQRSIPITIFLKLNPLFKDKHEIITSKVLKAFGIKWPSEPDEYSGVNWETLIEIYRILDPTLGL